MGILQGIEHVAAWAEAHPVIMATYVIPIGMAVFNFFRAPRTPDEYAALPPRIAALLKISSALFPNPHPAATGVKQFVEGSSVPASVIQARQVAAYARVASTAVTVPSLPRLPDDSNDSEEESKP